MSKAKRVGPVPRGVDADAIARSQDSFGELADSRGPDVDMDVAAGFGEQIAQLYFARPDLREGIARQIADIATNGDLQQIENARAGLARINAKEPGLAAELVKKAGAPEVFASEYMSQEEAAAAAPAGGRKKREERPPLERWRTYGTGDYSTRSPGLREMVKEETRSRASRIGEVTPGSALGYEQRMVQYLTAPEAFRAKLKQQRDQIAQTPLTEEMMALLPVEELSARNSPVFAGIRPGSLLSPEQIASLSFDQRNLIVPFGFDFSNLDASGGGFQTNAESRMESANSDMRYQHTSTTDQKIMGLLSGKVPHLDSFMRGWRYPFPIVVNGELVRPTMPPTGDFLARLLRDSYELKSGEVPNFVAQAGPVLDQAVRQQYSTDPSRELYRGQKGRSAFDFSQLILPPDRGGYYLKQADTQGWPFEPFIPGLEMNRGPKAPINLGGLLLDDTVSAPQPDSTISTPEEPVAPPPDEPPVMPADTDMSMYDPRSRASILAALLA